MASYSEVDQAQGEQTMEGTVERGIAGGEAMNFEQAEKKAKRFFKTNHYHVIDRCCDHCRFACLGWGGAVDCTLAEAEEWYTGGVAPYGVCDRYEEEKP